MNPQSPSYIAFTTRKSLYIPLRCLNCQSTYHYLHNTNEFKLKPFDIPNGNNVNFWLTHWTYIGPANYKCENIDKKIEAFKTHQTTRELDEIQRQQIQQKQKEFIARKQHN